MRLIIFLLIGALGLTACHNVEDKTKKVIHKTGEAIGQGSSEFEKGISKGKGADDIFDSEVVISDELKQKGVSSGKFDITKETESSKKNKFILYLIFDKDFNGNISAKVFDLKGKEYGRTSISISAKHGETRYVDFIFDPRTDVESKSKFMIE